MAKPLRVLIAEDELLNAMALRCQLEALGHHAIGPATTGREAIDLAERRTIDMAILDIRMPELSGLEAAREIFRVRPTPIILLSGYHDPDYVAQARLAPVFHYLVKPATLDDLAPAIRVSRARFDEWEQFRRDAEAYERKLEERRLIAQAKEVLQETRGLLEPEAFRLLQNESHNKNQPMADVARSILMTEALLHDPALS